MRNLTYDLLGACVEVCSCGDVCPCSTGASPDGGSCEATTAYHVRKGRIEGVDVSGLTVVKLAHNTGNILGGGTSRYVLFVDERATDEQERLLVEAFEGKLGGPLADVARLWDGQTRPAQAVQRAPIAFERANHHASVRVGDRIVQAIEESFTSVSGRPTRLEDPVASPIPGAPLHLGRATLYKAEDPAHDFRFEFHGHSARDGEFDFHA